MKRLFMLRLFVLSFALVGLSGCATHHLWSENRLARLHEPASPPNLQLAYDTRHDDVLVVFDEVVGDSVRPHARAFLLMANQERIEARHRPAYVKVPDRNALSPIPIFTAPGPAAESMSTNLFWAVTTSNPHTFDLYSREHLLGNYRLPVYEDASGRVIQVMLTPLAVAADAAVIGGVAYIWYQSGAVPTPCCP